MILTDREIKIAIEERQIILDPLPEDIAFSSTAVDLTLHQEVRVFKLKAVGGFAIDPSYKDYSFQDSMEAITDKVNIGNGYNLEPKRLLLGWTKETVELPTISRLAARVEGKSSLARIGLGIHITAPTIHAGFKGQLQLEIINHGAGQIVLRSGMRICQLIFEMTFGTAQKGYSGQFSGQKAF